MSSVGAGRRRGLLLTAAGFAGVDLAAKALAETRLGDASVDLGVLQLRLLFNDGVAFGLGDALPSWVVVAFTAAVTVAMIVYGWRHAPGAGWVQRLAGGAVIGGAAANVIDRLPDGVVTDYLHTGWWPTFNLADTFPVVGLLIFTLTTFRDQRPAKPSAPEPGADSGKAADEPRLLNPW
ncbi:signal peptidase II [Kribbella catacumbae]|uniref:signal peptidase II n=1 Tax=Kribbella catacumbae TaxID=460086 RepID=UPI00035E6B52|nr:signal peptidase II [Kribbella catacumbae]